MSLLYEKWWKIGRLPSLKSHGKMQMKWKAHSIFLFLIFAYNFKVLNGLAPLPSPTQWLHKKTTLMEESVMYPGVGLKSVVVSVRHSWSNHHASETWTIYSWKKKKKQTPALVKNKSLNPLFNLMPVPRYFCCSDPFKRPVCSIFKEARPTPRFVFRVLSGRLP